MSIGKVRAGLQQTDEEPKSDMAGTVVKNIEFIVSKNATLFSDVLLAD